MAINQFFGNTTINVTAGNTYRLTMDIFVPTSEDISNIIEIYPNISGKIKTEFDIITIYDNSSAKGEVITLESLYKPTTNESLNFGFVLNTSTDSDLEFNVDNYSVLEEKPLQPEQFNNTNVYDLALENYGTILGLGQFVGQLDTINEPVTIDLVYPEKIFTDFVPSVEIQAEQLNYNYIVRENASIYDVALQVDGKIEGLSKILSNYSTLDQDITGTNIRVKRSIDPIFEELDDKKIFIATL